MTTSETTPSVAVLGLGPMGAALARALLDAGVPTTVWNRSPERSRPLAAEGADVAPDAAAAVASASLVVVCLRDHPAAREVLEGVPAEAYDGRTVVHFSSSTPAVARASAAWATGRGIDYLSGAILVPTPLVGDPEALFLYAGERALFDRHAELLRVLGGKADHLGSDHGLASLYDVAMLELFFAGMTAFLHAAAMVTAQGVDAKTFLPYAHDVLGTLGHSLVGLADDVDAGSHPGTEDNLAMELTALDHIVDTGAELGLDDRLPRLLRDVTAAAVERGHGGDGFSRVVEVLRGG
ncbi:MAG TPA: NAD(P)-binding domain-containing protein [Nocardioides sp.]|nr:NAD(P)-binding domain-containing protein [Nocardioides sp.]